MAESAALLVDEVFPEWPVRQWVLSVPYPLRFLFASRLEVMTGVLGIVYRCIATHVIKKAEFSRKTAQAGALEAHKGAEMVVRLARALPEHDFHLMGGTEQAIASWRDRYRWPNLHLHGYVPQPQLPRYIAAMDLSLLPNQPNPANAVLVEATDAESWVTAIRALSAPHLDRLGEQARRDFLDNYTLEVRYRRLLQRL